MKYALVSDVHSNLPALKALLTDVEARRERDDAVYHLGDLVGYAAWPDEVFALIREWGVPGIAGNYDSTVANDHEHCGCRAETQSAEELSHESYEWRRARVSAETGGCSASCPSGWTSGPGVTLVHGAPTLNPLYWTEDRPDSFCQKMAGAAGRKEGDMIAFGHTHKLWTREVEGVRFVNTGSVGKPKDGDWRSGYVLGEVGEEVGPPEFVRVEYDLERATDGILRSGLPDEFADQPRTGGTSKPVEVP